MLILNGNSLSERQKELNERINEAVANNIKLDEIKVETDGSDIDRLFKIGVASKYKDYHYIIEVLKSGDGLCISKALKCNWIYKDEFSDIIEPGYLHTNVFPFMSNKIKNKTLYTISKYVKSEKKAYSFYLYCKAQKMFKMSYKFLIFLSESIKLEEMAADTSIVTHRKGYLRKFFGSSFTLADAYLKSFFERQRNSHLNELFYLYEISSNKFLDLLEKYHCSSARSCKSFTAQQSEDIMKNHRQRFDSNFKFYFYKLNSEVLSKYITVDKAKDYIISLVREPTSFWDDSYHCCNILEFLPFEERFQFLKKVYMDGYNSEIEMDIEFYERNLYTLMTAEEREAWALRHLESGAELFGPGKNYIWYKFIHIDKSLPELKKYMLIATKSKQRLEILDSLVECARTAGDIEKFLNYYYERHVNEDVTDKEKFINKVLEIHDVYEFDERCWKALEKILCSMDLYDTIGKIKCKPDYRNMAIIYHILHKKDIPSGLMRYMDLYLNIEDFRTMSKTRGTEKDTMIYKYMIHYYVNKLQGLTEPEVKKGYVSRILDLLYKYNKSLEDCPDIVLDFAKLDPRFKKKKVTVKVKVHFNQDILIWKLKQNITSFLSDWEKVKEHIYTSRRFDLRKLLRKLRIYFYNDIAKDYLKLFEEILISQKESPKIHKRLIYTAVYGIFQLADANYIQDFMIKHAPLKRRTDYIESDPILLFTQYAICRCSCLPRPPAPLSCTLLYIKEDYLQYCSSTFSSFMANLAPTPRLEFIIALLDNAPSIQTHALRMLFRCFTPDHIDYVRKAWNNTEDVQVRKVLYTKLFETLLHIETEQEQVYELLLSCTVDLREDDHDDVYNLLSSDRMLGKFAAEYLTTAWTTVDKLPMRGRCVTVRLNIVNSMKDRMDILSKEFLFDIIEKHIKNILNSQDILLVKDWEYDWLQEEKENDPFISLSPDEINATKLNTNKWTLVKKVILKFDDKESVEISGRLIKLMMEQLSQIWNELWSDIYFVHRFLMAFAADLQKRGYDLNQNLPNIDLVFETILAEVQKSLPIYHTYLLIWDLKLTLIGRKVLHCCKPDVQDKDNNDVVAKVYTHYGMELGNLILEFIDKKIHYIIFRNEIGERIRYSINCIRDVLPQYISENSYDYPYIRVCESLVGFNHPEIDLITLKLTPEYFNYNCDTNISEYKEVIRKIDDCEDDHDEGRLYTCHKYMCYDYKLSPPSSSSSSSSSSATESSYDDE